MDGPWDIAIVGGGAAGLTAAIFAAQTNRSLRVCVLDGAKALGAKILVSGGGRCNVTHDRVTPADYNGPRNPVRNVLAAFDERQAVAWFQSLGVTLKDEETGKLFPTTDSARTVLNALLDRRHALGVTILTNHRVASVSPPETGNWELGTSPPVQAKRLILCPGGRSLPKTGSDGSGYELVKSLGHTVTPTYPALVPLVLDDSFFHAQVTGLSVDAELTTYADNKPVDRRGGSLLFTHFGLSGPLPMDASRHYILAKSHTSNVALKLNFLPGESFDSVDARLVKLTAARNKASVPTVLGTFLPQRLADALVQHVGIAVETTMSQLSKDARRKLAHALTALPLPVLRDRGWNYAEVTAGGVPMSEVDFRTLQSRKHAHLYLAGEILDVDGRIGGFNFQWAWATGHLAGVAAARSVSGADVGA